MAPQNHGQLSDSTSSSGLFSPLESPTLSITEVFSDNPAAGKAIVYEIKRLEFNVKNLESKNSELNVQLTQALLENARLKERRRFELSSQVSLLLIGAILGLLPTIAAWGTMAVAGAVIVCFLLALPIAFSFIEERR